MSDEETFDRLLRYLQKELAKESVKLLVIERELIVQNPLIYNEGLRIDNLAQIGDVIFIFEGKTKQEEKAVKQLGLYLMSLKAFRNENVKENLFFSYNPNLIRLFYYSFNEHEIVEYKAKGSKFERVARKWKDINELHTLLQKVFKGQNL